MTFPLFFGNSTFHIVLTFNIIKGTQEEYISNPLEIYKNHIEK